MRWEELSGALAPRQVRTLHTVYDRAARQPLTEGQIETAGATITRASVTIAALHALIDAARVIGRTLWAITVLASLGVATLWTHLHWARILHWLT